MALNRHNPFENPLDTLPRIIAAINNDAFKNERLNLTTGIEILDLGCSHGYYWFPLYKEINYKSITGIDKDNIEGLIKHNTFENYQELSNVNSLSKKEFNSIFIIIPNTDIFDFLESNTDLSYDLIIMSSLLYLLPSLDDEYRLIQMVKRFIKPNGYLYIDTNTRSRRRLYKLEFNERDKYEFPAIEVKDFVKLLEPEYKILYKGSPNGYDSIDLLAKKIN